MLVRVLNNNSTTHLLRNTLGKLATTCIIAILTVRLGKIVRLILLARLFFFFNTTITEAFYQKQNADEPNTRPVAKCDVERIPKIYINSLRTILRVLYYNSFSFYTIFKLFLKFSIRSNNIAQNCMEKITLNSS